MVELIRVTEENLDKEHICCAIASDKDPQVLAKKQWLRERFAQGLVFLKGNVRGKCFIEYIPAEWAWAPIEAAEYMYIDCLWVSGQFKGQGYSNLLLEACIRDSQAKGKKGLVILSAKKKKPFMSDPSYLAYKGFTVCDTAGADYTLMVLPFGEQAVLPRFKAQVKNPQLACAGFVLYYNHQCPFTAKYVPLLTALAGQKGAPFRAVRLESAQEAQNGPAVFTAFSLFYDGALVTHEILSEKKFAQLLADKGWS